MTELELQQSLLYFLSEDKGAGIGEDCCSSSQELTDLQLEQVDR